jgi:hypothetical protein
MEQTGSQTPLEFGTQFQGKFQFSPAFFFSNVRKPIPHFLTWPLFHPTFHTNPWGWTKLGAKLD